MWEERIANARIDIEMTRLLCLKAADMMDRAGNKAAQGEIAMIKVAAPIMALKIIDDAIQAFGAAGVSEDFRPGARLCLDPHAAPRRRAGRGPPPRDRPAGVQEAPMSEQPIDEAALGRWLEANVEGFQRPVRADQIPVRPVQPDLPDQRRVGRLCAAPQAVRAAAAVGACGRPRISAAVGAASARLSRCRGRSPCATTRTSSARSST